MHVQDINAIKQKGLHANYKRLVMAEKECMNKLKEVVLKHDIADKKSWKTPS